MRIRPILLRLVLLGGGILAGLLAGEVVLRLMGVVYLVVAPHPDPALGYTLKPGLVARIGGIPHRYNSRGLRDAEAADRPAPGVRRILCMGDSITYAQPIRLEDTYPKRLEARLGAERGGVRYEVLANGASRYNACQVEALYRDVGSLYHPDIVVWQWCLNDLEDPGDPFNEDLKGILPVPWRVKRFLRERSLVWNFLRAQSYGLLRAAGVVTRDASHEEYAREIYGHYGPDERERLERGIACLERGVERIEAGGAKAIVAIFPFAMQAAGEAGHGDAPQRLLLERCREKGLRCLDLLPAFQRGGWDLYLKPDFLHPNEAGHDAAAAALAVAIREIEGEAVSPP